MMDEKENQMGEEFFDEEEKVPFERAVSRDGKGLKLKFKMRNSSECSGEGLVNREENRVCKVCHKVFSSGRALGGHMRVHNQAEDDDFSRKHPIPKLKKLKNPMTNLSFPKKDNAESSQNGTTTCAICDKSFPSMKSLFGHMRCHPERAWRGIQPPGNGKHSSSSTVSDSIVRQKREERVDSTTTTIGSSSFSVAPFLPSWNVTARRGRKAITVSCVNSEDPEIPEAAYDLMMLSRGESFDSGVSNRRRSEESETRKRWSEESEAGNRDLTRKKMKIEEKGNVFDKYSGGSFSEESEEDSSEDEEPESKYTDYNASTFSSGKRMLKKKLKFRDLETVQDMGGVNVIDSKPSQSQSHTSPDKYKCTTCKKSFPSHQALGGHRSSHYKGRSCIQVQDELPLVAFREEEEEYEFNDRTEFCGAGSKAVGNAHRCQICLKTFATGQALGGHKRCHYTVPIEAAPSSSVASQEEEASKTETDGTAMGRRMLEFDLNEPAVMEEEDEGVKQPADNAAASSYNSAA